MSSETKKKYHEAERIMPAWEHVMAGEILVNEDDWGMSEDDFDPVHAYLTEFVRGHDGLAPETLCAAVSRALKDGELSIGEMIADYPSARDVIEDKLVELAEL